MLTMEDQPREADVKEGVNVNEENEIEREETTRKKEGKKEIIETKEEKTAVVRTLRDFFDLNSWQRNPFSFDIIPQAIVGYEKERKELLEAIELGEKVVFLLGPTGSGKTTLLLWLKEKLESEGKLVLFIPKAPTSSEELIDELARVFSRVWYFRIFPFLRPRPKTADELLSSLRKFLKKRKKRLVILVDESHEASIDVLRHFRLICDHVNASLIFSALPIFDQMLERELETLRRRATRRIIISNLKNESEVKELIEKRIALASNGKGRNPFTSEAIAKIFQLSHGLPREILRLCNASLIKAVTCGSAIIEEKHVPSEIEVEKKEEEKAFDLSALPRRQREILQAIIDGARTSSEIVEKIDISRYKSREHALRSVNNILQRLMKAGLITREQRGKGFVYFLPPALKARLARK